MFAPRPCQIEGRDFLSSRSGILAWEPGVGKTFAAFMAGAKVGFPQLYLTPANLRTQTAAAAREFDRALRIQVIEEAGTKIEPGADIVIASDNGAAGRNFRDKVTGKTKSDTTLYKRLFKPRWRSLVLDEAHRLKERDARRTRAIYGARVSSPGALFRRAEFTWALTGTPVLAHPADLWTHYSRLFPFSRVNDEADPLTYDEWVGTFCRVRKDGFGLKIVGGKNLHELAELIAPWCDRRTTVDTLGLELPTIDVIRLDAAKVARRIAQQVSPEALAQVEACLTCDDDLESIADAPQVSTLRRLIAEGKAPAVADLALTELAGGVDKIMVVGLHRDALRIVHAKLQDAGCRPVLYVGGMSPRNKDAAKQRFIDSPECRVLVGNIEAVGIGTDGLQAVCQRLLFGEGHWTPGINDQTIRRLWRSGQSRHVHASFAALTGSIDEAVQAANTRKARIIAGIFN